MRFLNFEDQLIPLDQWIQQFVDWLVMNYRDFFQIIKVPLDLILNGLQWVLMTLPPVVVILIFIVLAWRYASKVVAVFSLVTFMLIGYLGLWEDTMTTLAMVICAVIVCAVVGIPLGIMAGRSDRFEMILRPFLDAMQTTPAFVYLVPVVMLFSIGTVSGILATIFFALPPIIRLTSLGIRQVHPELVEAAIAFGATPWQVLRRVQFPLALPSVMAGLNQTHHDGPVDGRYRFHDRCRRLGQSGCSRTEYAGDRPGNDRWSGYRSAGHGLGPHHPGLWQKMIASQKLANGCVAVMISLLRRR